MDFWLFEDVCPSKKFVQTGFPTKSNMILFCKSQSSWMNFCKQEQNEGCKLYQAYHLVSAFPLLESKLHLANVSTSILFA